LSAAWLGDGRRTSPFPGGADAGYFGTRLNRALGPELSRTLAADPNLPETAVVAWPEPCCIPSLTLWRGGVGDGRSAKEGFPPYGELFFFFAGARRTLPGEFFRAVERPSEPACGKRSFTAVAGLAHPFGLRVSVGRKHWLARGRAHRDAIAAQEKAGCLSVIARLRCLRLTETPRGWRAGCASGPCRRFISPTEERNVTHRSRRRFRRRRYRRAAAHLIGPGVRGLIGGGGGGPGRSWVVGNRNRIRPAPGDGVPKPPLRPCRTCRLTFRRLLARRTFREVRRTPD